MDAGRRSVLHTLTSQQIFSECLDAVFRARIEMGCPTPDTDATENVVNVHLAHVLAQGFLADGHHGLTENVWDLRQQFVRYENPAIQKRQAWRTGIRCLFIYSQQSSSRTDRHGQITRQTRGVLVAIGSQAFGLTACLQPPSEFRDAVGRLAADFRGYGALTRQAGMVMGFHDEPEQLIQTDHPIVTLEDVLGAISAFREIPTRVNWQHLHELVEYHRWYHPNFHLNLPPEPVDPT